MSYKIFSLYDGVTQKPFCETSLDLEHQKKQKNILYYSQKKSCCNFFKATSCEYSHSESLMKTSKFSSFFCCVVYVYFWSDVNTGMFLMMKGASILSF